jgi:hypothetical protein
VPFKDPTGTCARLGMAPHAAMHNNDTLSRTRFNIFSPSKAWCGLKKTHVGLG